MSAAAIRMGLIRIRMGLIRLSQPCTSIAGITFYAFHKENISDCRRESRGQMTLMADPCVLKWLFNQL
jgi:hypothetical protein